MTASGSALTCPLCGSGGASAFHEDRLRPYWRCGNCRLVFVPPDHHLSEGDERERYDHHRNNPNDAGYRRFLSQLATPLLERLAPRSHGLDFGSGPGPTLSLLLEQAGHHVTLFDKYYAPDSAVLNDTYDFVTASEVVEHLREPGVELERLWACLKPKGWLGIMTGLVTDLEAFSNWHYTRDRTHICFFARESFTWLARRWRAEAVFIGSNVILLAK